MTRHLISVKLYFSYVTCMLLVIFICGAAFADALVH